MIATYNYYIETKRENNMIDQQTIALLAATLNIVNLDAFALGMEDGYEQGFELSTGMSYDDDESQWAYDTATYIGACLAVRSA